MISRNINTLWSSCILLFTLQSYAPSSAFLIPSTPTQANIIATREGQHCLSSAESSRSATTAATTTTGILYSSVFDMPSREKEDEDVQKKRNTLNNRNQKKFRLSNIVRQGGRASSPTNKEIMTQVHTLQEYKTHVADVTDSLVVVFFTAPWCRTCQRLKPKMRAMAAGLRGTNDVKLVEIPLLNKESSALFQGLGVKSFPFVHLYHPTEGLVEEMKLKRKLWNEFQTTLREYREGSCELQYHKDGTIRHEMRIQLLEP